MCDAYLAGIYGRKFEHDGWHVHIVESEKEVEQEVVKLHPNVLIYDTACSKHPEKDIRKLHKMPVMQKAKIVAFSEELTQEEIETLKKAGASGFLLKGHFAPKEAVQKVRRIIQV